MQLLILLFYLFLPSAYALVSDHEIREQLADCSHWVFLGGTVRQICYPSEVTPEMVQYYRQKTEIPYTGTQGTATSTTLPGINAVILGVDHERQTFVFNGMRYHSISREGCDRITPGMPLRVVHHAYARTPYYSNHAVYFRLPDETGCYAISLGPA